MAPTGRIRFRHLTYGLLGREALVLQVEVFVQSSDPDASPDLQRGYNTWRDATVGDLAEIDFSTHLRKDPR